MANEMSGRYGAVSVGGALSSIRNWRSSRNLEPVLIVASNTKAGHARRPGVSDWSGSYAAWGASPAVMPGGTGTFIGYLGPTSGIEGSVGPAVSGPMMVNGITVMWDYTAGAAINHTVNMEGNGPLTSTTATIVDGSNVNAPPIGPSIIQIKIGAGGSYAAICVAQATLNINSANQGYVNSCNYSGGVLSRKRVPGIIDWNVSLVVQNSDLATAGCAVGDYVALKLFEGVTNFWDLQWGLVTSFTDIAVDRESGAIIQYTINIEMSGDAGNGTAFNGLIKLPGAGANWWPFT
jgi:hypothetical protein